MSRPILLLLLVATVASCTSAPLEFADWTIPVPEGTRVIEYAAVPVDERTEEIGFVEDLALSGGLVPFYRPIDVDADAAGRVFVFDAGNSNIVVFGDDGQHIRTVGREGGGPGEISGGGQIAVVGDSLVHVVRQRLNAWSEDGEVLASLNLDFTNRLLPIAGTDQDWFVGSFRRPREDGTIRRRVVVRVSVEGELEHTYATLPDPVALTLRRRTASGEVGVNTMIPMPFPTFVTQRAGEVYVTAGDEYQILKFHNDEEVEWALRVAWSRLSLTDERIDEALRRISGADNPNGRPSQIPDPKRYEVDWPELMPALAGRPSAHPRVEPLRVDGHGHVYVFPFIPDSWDRPDQPVDVYSAGGEHLFSGMIPIRRWDAARGDYVYGIRTDAATQESEVVRYRLVEPF